MANAAHIFERCSAFYLFFWQILPSLELGVNQIYLLFTQREHTVVILLHIEFARASVLQDGSLLLRGLSQSSKVAPLSLTAPRRPTRPLRSVTARVPRPAALPPPRGAAISSRRRHRPLRHCAGAGERRRTREDGHSLPDAGGTDPRRPTRQGDTFADPVWVMAAAVTPVGEAPAGSAARLGRWRCAGLGPRGRTQGGNGAGLRITGSS